MNNGTYMGDPRLGDWGGEPEAVLLWAGRDVDDFIFRSEPPERPVSER